ncbi:hypothetical protein EUGRSUZ_K02935 [Eucalyptus grandis]|uniref:Uncharacterized protein n=2 Tax=Eucalyptus grandis TaxID=71139 RepID=A0ACC3IZ00_EUCGR|nr:hypothetical protein EUGRSUZ_K02935 [Eucalyptus grandis]
MNSKSDITCSMFIVTIVFFFLSLISLLYFFSWVCLDFTGLWRFMLLGYLHHTLATSAYHFPKEMDLVSG